MSEIRPSDIGSLYLRRRRGGQLIIAVEGEVDEGYGRHGGTERERRC